MINVKSNVIREQKNFWNNCIFHPTDAVEDAWGRRILDRMAEDGSIDTVRIFNCDNLFLKTVSAVTGRQYSKDQLILECDATKKSDSVIDKIIEAAES